MVGSEANRAVSTARSQPHVSLTAHLIPLEEGDLSPQTSDSWIVLFHQNR